MCPILRFHFMAGSSGSTCRPSTHAATVPANGDQNLCETIQSLSARQIAATKRAKGRNLHVEATHRTHALHYHLEHAGCWLQADHSIQHSRRCCLTIRLIHGTYEHELWRSAPAILDTTDAGSTATGPHGRSGRLSSTGALGSTTTASPLSCGPAAAASHWYAQSRAHSMVRTRDRQSAGGRGGGGVSMCRKDCERQKLPSSVLVWTHLVGGPPRKLAKHRKPRYTVVGNVGRHGGASGS